MAGTPRATRYRVYRFKTAQMVPRRRILEGLLAAFGGMGWVNQAGMKGNGKLVKPSAGWEKGRKPGPEDEDDRHNKSKDHNRTMNRDEQVIQRVISKQETSAKNRRLKTNKTTKTRRLQ